MRHATCWSSPTWFGLVVGLALCPTGVLAQSYGDQDQTLTVGAGAFRDENLRVIMTDDDGYVRHTTANTMSFRAPLALPEGAELRQMCLYANDPSANFDAHLSVVAVKLVPGGGGPATVTIPNSAVSSAGAIGYGYYCTGTFSYTIRDIFDVDGDGSPDAVVHYLEVDLPPSAELVEFGGVRVIWRRQVSAAPVTPSFGDVPADDGGFRFIEAMAASGITGGCGGGNYCPAASVTRRQMAVFLAKALGLHWGG